MNELEQALIARFGEKNVNRIVPAHPDDFPLLSITIEMRSKVTVIMTSGLSDYNMPVPEKYAARNHVELYFCLPSYWDIDSLKTQWVYEWIQKLAKHPAEKKTWFGMGHTIPNGSPAVPLSPTMGQNYLLLNGPMFLDNELQAITLKDFEVHFLGIIPIFEDEMDYKMGKGTYKLLQKMESKGITELLDDFRLSSLQIQMARF